MTALAMRYQKPCVSGRGARCGNTRSESTRWSTTASSEVRDSSEATIAKTTTAMPA